MSEYRVEWTGDGWLVMRRGGCFAKCSDQTDAERIARALTLLDKVEQQVPSQSCGAPYRGGLTPGERHLCTLSMGHCGAHKSGELIYWADDCTLEPQP